MKSSTLKIALLTTVTLIFGLMARAVPIPGGGPGVVIYNPINKIIQGDQPLVSSYPLSITSPANLTQGTSVTVPLNVTILSKPAAVSDAQALSFLSLDSSFTFTGPSQTLTTQVTLDVPLGNVAGSYAYLIKASGWPAGLTIEDIGTTVNALVAPATTENTDPPSVILQTPLDGSVYTYYPVSGNPVDVPITFDGSVGPNGQPLTLLAAYVNDVPVSASVTGIGTLSGSGTASLQLTTPGTYVIKATATNTNGTSEDSADISVVLSAPPPTITVASPQVDAAYSYNEGEPGASVSVSYTATSLYGNITATGATLNGSAITLDLSGVGTNLIAVGSTTLTVQAGSHVLSFTASNEYGDAEVVEVPFTVKELDAAPIIPTVNIITPVDGSIFERTEGDAPTAVDFTYEGGTSGGTIESVTVMIDGVVVSSTVVGLNTADITGSGSASYSETGTHTLTVTVSNGEATATDSTTFTVNETPVDNELCATLRWLPPVSLNKVWHGGRTIPIKFTLTCDCDFVRDESILISIYEVYEDDSISEPIIYPYGVGSPNPPDYAITGHQYHLNFDTAEGVHRYRVEVYYPLNDDGSSLQLLGTTDILTKGNSGKSDKSNKSCKSDKSGKSGKSDKSDKSSKSDKSDKSGKSDKSDKSSKSDKSDKSDKSGKSDKSDKSSKSDKSDKSGKSDKSDKSSKSDKSDKDYTYDSDGHHSNYGVTKGNGHDESHGDSHGDTDNGKGGGEGSYHDGDSKSNSDHSKNSSKSGSSSWWSWWR